ncbi:MAG: hypothetical protein ACTSU7_06995 [Candidatus Heimdallarchaeaceae archaeon]
MKEEIKKQIKEDYLEGIKKATLSIKFDDQSFDVALVDVEEETFSFKQLEGITEAQFAMFASMIESVSEKLHKATEIQREQNETED